MFHINSCFVRNDWSEKGTGWPFGLSLFYVSHLWLPLWNLKFT